MATTSFPRTILLDVVQHRRDLWLCEEQCTALLPVRCRPCNQFHIHGRQIDDPLHGFGILLQEVHKACLNERHLEPANGHLTMLHA